MTRVWPIASSRQALGIGAAWLVLTLAFEFLLFVAAAPYLFHRPHRQR